MTHQSLIMASILFIEQLSTSQPFVNYSKYPGQHGFLQDFPQSNRLVNSILASTDFDRVGNGQL